MTWAVGMSDKAAEWMQRLARGVLPFRCRDSLIEAWASLASGVSRNVS